MSHQINTDRLEAIRALLDAIIKDHNLTPYRAPRHSSHHLRRIRNAVEDALELESPSATITLQVELLLTVVKMLEPGKALEALGRQIEHYKQEREFYKKQIRTLRDDMFELTARRAAPGCLETPKVIVRCDHEVFEDMSARDLARAFDRIADRQEGAARLEEE